MILLDTNAVLWVVQPERLGNSAKALLSKGDEVRFGHLCAGDVDQADAGSSQGRRGVREALRAQGLVELEFSTAHAAGLLDFPQLIGHDPFDRALVAQAHVERALFVTSDRHLLGLGLDWVVDARS